MSALEKLKADVDGWAKKLELARAAIAVAQKHEKETFKKWLEAERTYTEARVREQIETSQRQ